MSLDATIAVSKICPVIGEYVAFISCLEGEFGLEFEFELDFELKIELDFELEVELVFELKIELDFEDRQRPNKSNQTNQN